MNGRFGWRAPWDLLVRKRPKLTLSGAGFRTSLNVRSCRELTFAIKSANDGFVPQAVVIAGATAPMNERPVSGSSQRSLNDDN